jgi:integrase/recombinase XerD
MRAGRKPGPERYAGDVGGAFRNLLMAFIEHLRARQYSEHTIKNHRIDVGYFIAWCEDRSLTEPVTITPAHLEAYRMQVYRHRRPDGATLSFNSQKHRLTAVRIFFQWLTRQRHLLTNPASELELPRAEKRLPKHVLTIAEVDHILHAADPGDPLGLRDRAMLETLYSTGIRRAELVGLACNDLDIERGTLMIRQGKGKRDRVVPIGERACAWIDQYLRHVRPLLVDEGIVPRDGGALFVATSGEGLSGNRLSEIARQRIEQAGLARSVSGSSCHLFRHACATHMLERGADIRYIQALLGHADLSTTEIYTQVSIVKLKEIHSRTHPARLTREVPIEVPDSDRLREQLMAALAAETEG